VNVEQERVMEQEKKKCEVERKCRARERGSWSTVGYDEHNDTES